MLLQLIKMGRPSEQAGSSTNASVLYGVGTRFVSGSRPRISWLRFLFGIFTRSPSGRMPANYFTLGNDRVFHTISNSLFTNRCIFRSCKAWDAENAVKLTKELIICAKFLLTSYRRSGAHKFSKKSRRHLQILGMKQVLYWGPTDIKRQRTKFTRRGDLAPRFVHPCVR
jgi:hypothetical protein